MCGLAGIVAPATRGIDGAWLCRASEMLAHRGPDDHGFLVWDGGEDLRAGRQLPEIPRSRVALAHRRLAILDLGPGGWQPMSSPDGRHHIVFNGEIYNYRELRVELEAAGYRFRSKSDSEVLLAALAVWGRAALGRFVGMFAFAWLDTSRRRVLLVRDFFGIKPLYYRSGGHGLAFASEIGPLLELGSGEVRANPRRVFDYLRFGLTDHDRETLFADVSSLPPAHYAEVDLDGKIVDTGRYWQVDLSERCDLSFDQAADKLRELFLDSVRLHLRSDVPIGAALSGGIDSSAIVMAMRHLEGDSLDLHTISYVADDPRVSEEKWVAIVHRASGARAHVTRPEPGDLARDLEHLIQIQAEPFGSTSIYAQHRVFELAREAGVKVMLDGQGADELLGGYRSYLGARLTSLVRGGRWPSAWRFLNATAGLPGQSWRDALVGLSYSLLPEPVHALARRVAGRDLVPSWIDGGWFDRVGVDPRSPLPRAHGPEALRGYLLETLTVTSVPLLLRYEDRNSMAHSIESRVPFLTPALAQFLLSLPEHYIISPDGTTKAIFRKAMRGIVPDAILDRRDKIGFQTPEQEWLTRIRDWVESCLESDTARSLPALRLAGVHEDWRAIVSGRKPWDWHVWRWINLIRWTERFGVTYESV